ncbi:hypothetical protein C7999DRAFT_28474 [Corynascus novoguineensis]|uniref:Arginyl-tRNA synthetase catalytic core domain-containing protein n=1 Tax=Corynascus novoguineensis TaxID=1126955 RepID=A0AAN7D1C2_9PEZI|nr:hypothetical protein C7999DRAFT_28474 [Corynascus novoguineensis]
MGWDVVRVNYLGDLGQQFGWLSVGWEQYCSDKFLQAQLLKHLLDVYVKINAEFKPEKAACKQARDEGRDTTEIKSQGLFAKHNAFLQRMEDDDEEALRYGNDPVTSASSDTTTYTLGLESTLMYAGESQVNPATVAEVEPILKEKGVY